MNVISAENISKSYGERVLFRNISFGLEEGKKAALVGLNGTGKTTLLNVLSGRDVPEQGQVIIPGRIVSEVLEQNPRFEPDLTILEQIFKGTSDDLQLIREYEYALEQLSQEDTSQLWQSRLNELTRQMEHRDLWTLETEAKSILNRLGIRETDRRMGDLSGGELKRVFLAGALIRPADLLILDEPTNHLDSETIDWLENVLSQRRTTLLMVTHDRYFLDRVTDVIFELSGGSLYRCDGNFSVYLEERARREQMFEQQNEKHKKLLKSELQWIRSGVQGRGTRQKARVQRFETLRNDVRTGQNRELSLDFRQTRLGKKILILDRVTKAYDEPLIRDFSYQFKRGDRIGIVGPNGSGKTTLLDLIAGQVEPDAGSVIRGETLNVGYFRQADESMDSQETILSWLEADRRVIIDSSGKEVTAAGLLERFLFSRDRHWQPIGTLSGGERRRLALLKVLMGAPNMLLLDEPTNDLDLDTLMVLEDYLEAYAGVLIMVSHDRFFLNKLADQMFSFDGQGKIQRISGNYDDFVAFRKKRAPGSDEGKHDSSGKRMALDSNRPGGRKLTYSESLEYASIEADIEQLEAALREADERLVQLATDYQALQEAQALRSRLEAALEDKMVRWMELAGKAEEGVR